MFGQTCSVCLMELVNNAEKLIFLDTCCHPFCKECITEWIRSGKITCPYCREEINKEDYKQCGIRYRNSELQQMISDLIDAHHEDLEIIQEDYNYILSYQDNEDFIAENNILFERQELMESIKDSESVIIKKQENVYSQLRNYTQDDIDVINSIQDYSKIHEIVENSMKEITFLKNDGDSCLDLLNNFIRHNREIRKRKRKDYEKEYTSYKNEIIGIIKEIKEI